MKRLKFSCPFGGKSYPAIAAVLAGIAAAILCSYNLGLPTDSVFAAAVIAVLLALGICFYLEHRLTEAELQAIENSQLPLWQPVNEDIIERVRDLKRLCSVEGLVAGGSFLLLSVISWPTAAAAGEKPIAGKIFLLFGLGILGVDFFCSFLWRSIDGTAVYTFIPIDHMYDVTHHHKDGDYTISYIVFYQPDGRYVLRARYGSGDYGAIAVVKFRGMITWVSVPRTKYVSEDGEII